MHADKINQALALIRRAVADYYGATDAELDSKTRIQRVSTPRMVAMKLAMELTPATLEQSAAVFNCGHGAAFHARQEISNREATEPRFAGCLAELRAECKARIDALPAWRPAA